MDSSHLHKLDDAFSEYIRLRDADDKGCVVCPLCGTPIPWKESDAMHYIDRGNMATRYHEKNVNAGCVDCNRFKDGNIDAYESFLENKYGDTIIEELEFLKHNTLKISNNEAKLLIKHYREKSKQLRKEKGL